MSQLIGGGYSSIEQMTELVRNNSSVKIQPQNRIQGTKSFREILDAVKSSELVFSKHANERLLSRNIDLSDSQLERLQTGTRRAGEKGTAPPPGVFPEPGPANSLRRSRISPGRPPCPRKVPDPAGCPLPPPAPASR